MIAWSGQSEPTPYVPYYGCTSGTTIYVNYSNYSSSTDMYRQFCQESEEEEKLRHAAEMRKRDLSYLWKPLLRLKRLRFQVVAPFTRFIPCWSANRWKSCT